MASFTPYKQGIYAVQDDTLTGAGYYINNNFKTIADLLQIGNQAYTTLSPTDDGSTLTTTYSNYFCSVPEYNSYSVTLPDAASMAGRTLTFVVVDPVYEAGVNVFGPISFSGTNFFLLGGHTVTLLCDGTRYWVTSQGYN